MNYRDEEKRARREVREKEAPRGRNLERPVKSIVNATLPMNWKLE